MRQWRISACHGIRAATILGVVLAGAAGLAHAQIEEIVVTAKKREQNLQRVPVAISAFGTEDIDRTGAARLRDIAFLAPNFAVPGGKQNFNTNIVIRGIPTNTRNIGFDSAAGVYVDGVYMGRTFANNQDLLDIERIEVLRGPQGTVWGRNTIAGAINIVTQSPTEELTAQVRGEAGSEGHLRGRGSASFALAENVAARLSGFFYEHDGYVTNIGDGSGAIDGTGDSDLFSEDSLGGRVQLRFTPSDRLDINLSADYLNDEGVQSYPGVWEGPGALPGTPIDRRNIDPTAEDREIFGGSVTVDYDLGGGLVLTSVTAVRSGEAQSITDDDLTFIRINGADFSQESDQVSQELRITSPTDRRLSYVAGIYYLTEEIGQAFDIAFLADHPLIVFGIDPNAFILVNSAVESEMYAAFGQLDYRFTEALSGFLGLRFTYQIKDLDYTQMTTPIILPDLSADDRYTEGNLSPEAGFSYQAADDVNLYFRYARGFKGGGFNADILTTTTGIEFEAETVDSFELGAKTEWLGNRLRLNAAVYYLDYLDIQRSRIITIGGAGGLFVDNASKAESKGLEVELLATPTDRLEIGTSFGYADATFEEFVVSPTDDRSGNRLGGSPEWTGSFYAQYSQRIGGLDLIVRGEYDYLGDYFVFDQNADTNLVDSRGLVNARIGIAAPDGNWEVFLWSMNLFDEEYETFRRFNPFLPGPRQTADFGAPRIWGIELAKRFGQ